MASVLSDKLRWTLSLRFASLQGDAVGSGFGKAQSPGGSGGCAPRVIKRTLAWSVARVRGMGLGVP
ncbi:MAG: hypothetical protein HUK20_10420 [Fibrobacter sp.]|nr:hypothetical protein [Fibrobacter sp.]